MNIKKSNSFICVSFVLYYYNGFYSIELEGWDLELSSCLDFAAKDRVACFSNRYKNLDLLAPGAKITSTATSGSNGCASSSSSFQTCSGTSMAAPHVAGAAAILQQMYDRNLTSADIKAILKITGEAVKDPEVNGRYFPRINVYDAVRYAPFIDVLNEDWPFYHHDLRRTGFTKVEGDMATNSMKKYGLGFEGELDAAYFDYPSIADIDSDGAMEIVTATSRWGTAGEFDGKLYAISNALWWLNPITGHPSQNDLGNFEQDWKFEPKAGYIIPRAPSIANLTGGNDKFVVFIAQPNNTNNNAYVYAVNGKTGKEKYKYEIKKDPLQSNFTLPQYGQTAVVDIDLDGKLDVLFTDYGPSKNWQGYLYWLDSNLRLKGKFTIGNYNFSGGAVGAIAVANINKSSAYPEIIVPSSFGIYMYQYNGTNLSKAWNNSDARIDYTAVIADVDLDNKFEVVYTTQNDDSICSSISCTKKLHVVNALTGVSESSATLTDFGKEVASVGNLDTDAQLEIVLQTRALFNRGNASYGHIRVFDGKTLTQQWQYPSGNTKDTTYAAPDVFDIDGDGDFNVVASFEDGELVMLDNDGTYLFSYSLGGDIASAPAVADLDNDGKAEIAAKHLTSTSPSGVTRVFNYENYLDYIPGQFSALDFVTEDLAFIGNENNIPQLDILKDVYAKEGDFVNLTASGIDLDNDPIVFNYTYPFDSKGDWQTDVNSSGNYIVTVEASDGNLTEEQDILVVVYNSSVTRQNNFSDSASQKNLTFSQAGNMTVYVNVSSLQKILRAALEVFGFTLQKESNTYQEPNATVIQANELNISANNVTDKNWDTYYSAGSLTGVIVELKDLTVPANPTHLVLHLKLQIYPAGYGDVGLYNYNTSTYEIKNAIQPFTNASKDFYIDFYETSPLWETNATHYSTRVNELNTFISGNKVRWYYRYVGDWAYQRVYESEVKFEEDLQRPTNVFIDVGNDGSKDFIVEGELFEDTAIQRQLNNSKYNDTFRIPVNSSVTRYVRLPKNITLFDAEVSIGEAETTGLSIKQTKDLHVQSVLPNYQEKNFRLGDYTFHSVITVENNVTQLHLELVGENEAGPITIRDVFAQTDDVYLGHVAVNKKFENIGDAIDLRIDLNREVNARVYNVLDYLMYNYYSLDENEKTENGEHRQYVGAEL